MISGLGMSSSGIATAVRTAGKARATMDTMTRQIATGQKVASVKDDGAAWARAAGLRADMTAQKTYQDRLDLYSINLSMFETISEEQLAVLEDVRAILTQALNHQAGSPGRQTLEDSLHAIAVQVPNVGIATVGALTNHLPLDATHGPLQGMTAIGVSLGELGTNVLQPLSAALNLTAASVADITTALSTVITETNVRRSAAASNTALSARQLEIKRDSLSRSRDTAAAALASLTDADLGKASTVHAQAQTRQQLALATLRQALEAYGAFAGGLLGNVQRTQRGIRA
jgi:flagellin